MQSKVVLGLICIIIFYTFSYCLLYKVERRVAISYDYNDGPDSGWYWVPCPRIFQDVNGSWNRMIAPIYMPLNWVYKNHIATIVSD